MTATITETATVTITPTPTITPAGVCATPGSGLVLPVSDDTWIEAAAPTAVHGIDTTLSIRANSGGDQRILLKFNLPALIEGSSVVSAKLYFYINSNPITPPSGATIFLYKPVTGWAGTSATWREAQSGTNWLIPGGDYNPAPIISTATMGGCQVELDVTLLVQDWLSSPNPNNGIILIASGSSGEISIPSSSEANGPIILVVTNTP